MIKFLLFIALVFSSKISFSQIPIIDDVYFETQEFPYKSELVLSGSFPICTNFSKKSIVLNNEVVKVFLESEPILEMSCADGQDYLKVEVDPIISGNHRLQVYVNDFLSYEGDVDFRLPQLSCNPLSGCFDQTYGFSSSSALGDG